MWRRAVMPRLGEGGTLPHVDLDVAPYAEPAVREAIAAALEERRRADAEAAGTGAWWRAGIEESVREDLDLDV